MEICMRKHSDLSDILKWMGIIVISGGVGIGGSMLVIDGIDRHYEKLTGDLPLLVDGAHLKAGTHRVVIGGQFMNMLKYDTTEEDQDLALRGIAKAYENLNDLNSEKLQFKLCTTEDGLQKYGITKIDKINKNDIPLYITNDFAENPNIMAETDWHYDNWTRELKDQSITYKKKYLSSVWKAYETMEKTLAAENSLAYTITAHESMHLMGFAHYNGEKSLMNTYSTGNNTDFEECDKKMIAKYNETFYNTKTKYSTTYANTKPSKKLEFEEETL